LATGSEPLSGAEPALVEATPQAAEPDEVPVRWRELAFRSYIALQRLDAALLEPRLPASMFYNLVLSAERAA